MAALVISSPATTPCGTSARSAELVQELGQSVEVEPLVWALVIGADFGGNATIVGASANVVVSRMSEAQGHPISFRTYLRYGVPATILTMLIGTLDVWLRYIIFR
jgi:Na+/H+ antiporter NhaD/arsenite permease-like protein